MAGDDSDQELRFRRRAVEQEARFEARLEEEVALRLALQRADVAREVAAAERPLQEELERQRAEAAAALRTAQTELERRQAEAETELIELRRQLTVARSEAASEAATTVLSLRASHAELEKQQLAKSQPSEAGTPSYSPSCSPSLAEEATCHHLAEITAEQMAHRATQVRLLAAQRERATFLTAFGGRASG